MTSSRTRRYLMPGEPVFLETRAHPVVLVRPALAALIVAALAAAIGYVTGPDDGGDAVDLAAGTVSLWFFLRLAYKTWAWSSRRIALTDRRVVIVAGRLIRKVSSVPLDRSTEVTYRRRLLGRLLGYGDVMLQGGAGRIEGLPDPDRFYRAVVAIVAGAPDPYEDAYLHEEEVDTGPLHRVIV